MFSLGNERRWFMLSHPFSLNRIIMSGWTEDAEPHEANHSKRNSLPKGRRVLLCRAFCISTFWSSNISRYESFRMESPAVQTTGVSHVHLTGVLKCAANYSRDWARAPISERNTKTLGKNAGGWMCLKISWCSCPRPSPEMHGEKLPYMGRALYSISLKRAIFHYYYRAKSHNLSEPQ